MMIGVLARKEPSSEHDIEKGSKCPVKAEVMKAMPQSERSTVEGARKFRVNAAIFGESNECASKANSEPAKAPMSVDCARPAEFG